MIFGEEFNTKDLNTFVENNFFEFFESDKIKEYQNYGYYNLEKIYG